MATDVEARLKIKAVDDTAKGFASFESRLKKAERLSEQVARRERQIAKIDRAHGLAAKVEQREAQVARQSAMAAGVGRLGGMAAGALGGALATGAIVSAVKDYAALERQMTRIGLAAGATDEETKSATQDVAKLADAVALPLDQAVTGLDALVATGMNMREAMAFLPSVLRTAQASGSSTDELAASANALGTSFKVAGGEMQQAFDMLVTGGQLGQFELKDMARYLPSLTASAAKLGYSGLDGTKKLVAMLQTVRQVTGTSEEAATAVRQAFEKILSPTVAAAFKKQGVNIGQVLEKAAKTGKDQFEAVLDVLGNLTKGMSETQRNMMISSIFTDEQARTGVTALLKLRDAYKGYQQEIGNSAGAVEGNLNRVLADTQAAVDRLDNAWGKLWKTVGKAADSFGASTVMEKISGGLNYAVDQQQSALDANKVAQQVMDKEGWDASKRRKFTMWASGDDIRDLARRGGWRGTPEEEAAAAEKTRVQSDSRIVSTEKTLREAEQQRDSGIFPYVPGEVEKARAAHDQALNDRAQAEAQSRWGGSEGAPAWMRGEAPIWSNLADMPTTPRPEASPLRGVPLPPANPERAAPTMSFEAAPVGAGVEDLRAAFDQARGSVSDAGTEAGTAIEGGARQGADLLNGAADNLRRAGQDAAAAISAAKPQAPAYSGPVGRGAYARPNANLGASMPTAGTPGAP
ncbi:TP901 family phage tail tape measure protein [Angulomicrobium tetraedrale]|uniref:TP901 family phage tail tape measure protein n=1 Tax=Ancylobacter tetraedralis TaxID=217068 RepID=A0A839Z9W7_9HYPH|nr:phage tail tape measure protein [Ancylobacter tetraedralis]MBB3771517.1 TP901 family phage tail tape measure protein [Ancylobacter tetraedralis]